MVEEQQQQQTMVETMVHCANRAAAAATAPTGIRCLLSTRAKLCSNYSRIRYIFVAEDEIRVVVAVNLRRQGKIQVYCTVRH